MAKLNMLVLKTRDPKRLSGFYELLGLEFNHHRHGSGPYHYANEQDGFVFEIYPLPNEKDPVDISSRLGFEIEDLRSTIDSLKNNNNEIIREPKQTEWGLIAVVKDPDGRKVELKEV